MENKYEILLKQVNKVKQSKGDNLPKEALEINSQVEIHPMKLENGIIVPATKTESPNIILAVLNDKSSSGDL